MAATHESSVYIRQTIRKVYTSAKLEMMIMLCVVERKSLGGGGFVKFLGIWSMVCKRLPVKRGVIGEGADPTFSRTELDVKFFNT
jgi:hypothetical protein